MEQARLKLQNVFCVPSMRDTLLDGGLATLFDTPIMSETLLFKWCDG